MITVWGRRNSMNVQKVMWTLGELDLAYERHDVAGSFGTDDDYLAINPNGTVPAIRDGDVTMFESNACVRYLAREYGPGTLWPAAAAELAQADQWMDWLNAVLGPAFFSIFLNRIRLPADKADEAQAQRGIEQTGKLLGILERHLSNRQFVAGNNLTMGDMPIGPILYRYYQLNIERPSLPAVEAYYGRLSERAAYQKHVMIPFGSNVDEWLVEEKKNAGIQ